MLDGITGCTWLAIKQWKLWFIFNRKAASKLRRGDGAQKAGLRFHRSANARWLRSEVTRSTLQLAQTSLLLRSTQQRSLPRLKRKQSKAETYASTPPHCVTSRLWSFTYSRDGLSSFMTSTTSSTFEWYRLCRFVLTSFKILSAYLCTRCPNKF